MNAMHSLFYKNKNGTFFFFKQTIGILKMGYHFWIKYWI